MPRSGQGRSMDNERLRKIINDLQWEITALKARVAVLEVEMTDEEARAIALERWGKWGWVSYANDPPRVVVGVREPQDRGTCSPPWNETEYGVGATWDKAFADATSRGH